LDKKAKIAVISALVLVAVLLVSIAIAKPGPTGVAKCKDNLDNDGDGYTDWPSDPGCSSRNDNSELNAAVQCDDGTDNDGDSATDMNDGGCASPTDNDETNCGDGVCEGGETSGTCPVDCGYVDSCAETDGGNVIAVFGTASGYYSNNPYSNNDYCVDTSDILEYYCSGAYQQSQQQSCGTDEYVGSNFCMSGDVYKNYTDYSCGSGTCSSGTSAVLQEDCVSGQYCNNGQCLWSDSCSDTDGGIETTVYGSVSGYDNNVPYSINDYCMNSTTISENFCAGASSVSYSLSCVNQNTTSCVSGACV